MDLAEAAGESPLRLRRMDRSQALGFAAARIALRGARAAPVPGGDPDWGIFLGSSLACWASNALFFLDLLRRPLAELSPALFARTVPNAVSGEISIAHGIGGVSQTFVSGWTAGAEALAEAAAFLAEGRARWLVAGGVEAPDALLRSMYTAARSEVAEDWLPAEIAEAAAVLVLTGGRDDSPGTRIRAFCRSHDTQGRFSLAEALDLLPVLSIGTLIVANTVPPRILDRWRLEMGRAEVVVLPESTGEIGAAGAPVAAALAASRVHEGRGGSVVILARGMEGNTVLLALGP